MRKNLPLLLVFILAFFCSQAQVKLGAEIGFHSASVLETNTIPGWDTAVKPFYSARTAIHFGVKLEIPLGSNFFFQPSLNYTSKGRQYAKNNNALDSSSL